MEPGLLTRLTTATWNHAPPTIERVLDDDATVRRVAADSYRHDNGFTKLVLTLDRGMKLRFHLWTSDVTSDSNVHNHRWDFASVVLAGALRMEYFEITDGPGTELEGFRYLPPHAASRYELRPIGPVHVVRTATVLAEVGYRYELDHRILHRVTAPVTPAVTCFLSASARVGHTTVLRHPGAPAEDGRLERLTVAEARTELSAVRDLLGA